MNDNLKKDILSAFGTARYLQQISGMDIPLQLAQTLLYLENEKVPDLAQARKNLTSLTGLDPAVFDVVPRLSDTIEPEFALLDEQMQETDPAFPKTNTKYLDHIFRHYGYRPSQPAPFSFSDKARELLRQLDTMTGLDSVKEQVHTLAALARMNKVRQAKGLKAPAITRHFIFTGAPGTGKTTIARLLAQLFHELGLLSKGQLVEVQRADLVAGHVGQTALKTEEAVKKALGGILFIDEAYSLYKPASQNDFGTEAIETLLKLMEDNRDDLCVIAAGYEANMEEFLNSNPGLRSRFPLHIQFENYSPRQLVDILEKMAENMDYHLTPQAREYVQTLFEKAATQDGFANARTARTLLEKAVARQAVRLLEEEDPEKLTELVQEDFPSKLV